MTASGVILYERAGLCTGIQSRGRVSLLAGRVDVPE
jgi:hypothetical protein